MKLLSLMFLFVFTLSTNEINAAQINITELIPTESMNLEVLGMEEPKEVDVITKKMKKSMEKDLKWANKYIKKHAAADEKLPYHEKLGINESEYNKFIELKGKKVITVVAKKKLRLKETINGISWFYIEGLDPEYATFGIDVENKILFTKFGEIENPDYAMVDSNEGIGSWSGLKWESNNLENEWKNGNSISVIFGKLKDKNSFLFSYKYYVIKNDIAVSMANLDALYK